MEKIYIALIYKGLKTIDDVPKSIREKVRQMILLEDDYTEDK